MQRSVDYESCSSGPSAAAAGIVFAAVRSEKTRRGSRIHEIFLQEMKRAMASVNACRFKLAICSRRVVQGEAWNLKLLASWKSGKRAA